ncbi:uncharacterized protein LOC134650296 [Cydia amplana]|uniref:uncharacterized protein LOC134650296 n=1 Tax=Cydia amplana TaxID=1869771 RepID=UPI002FE6AE33
MFCLCSSITNKMIGPGVFKFQSFEHCDPPVTEVDLWLTQRKFNRTTNVIDMTLSTPWPLSDEIIMEVDTSSKKDGGYKPGSFYMKGPFCKTLQSLIGDLFDAIVNATGFEECPIPGDIKLDGFYVDSEKLNDQMLYGDYRAQLSFFIDGETKGCYIFYMQLMAKEEE